VPTRRVKDRAFPPIRAEWRMEKTGRQCGFRVDARVQDTNRAPLSSRWARSRPGRQAISFRNSVSEGLRRSQSRKPLITLAGLLLGALSALVIGDGARQVYEFRRQQQHWSIQAVQSTAATFEYELRSLEHSVSVFALAHRSLIQQATIGPARSNAFEQLRTQIEAYFPDSLAFAIAHEDGDPIAEAIAGITGPPGRAGLQALAPDGTFRLTLLHPNPGHFYLDVNVALPSDGDRASLLFLVRFHPKLLARQLELHRTPGHQLMLLRSDPPTLIEVTVEGAHDLLSSPPELSPAELSRIGHSVPLPQTGWRVVDLLNAKLLGEFQRTVWVSHALILLGIFVLTLGLVSMVVGREGKVSHLSRALGKAQERYRSIVEEQVELVLRFRPDGTLNFVNAACSEYLGRAKDELLGTSLFDRIPQEERKAIQDHLKRLDPQRPSARIRHRVQLADGQLRWLERSDRIIPGDTEHAPEYQTVARDITEQKIMEEALREREEQYRDLVENSQDLIWTVDDEGRWIFLNAAAEAIFGYESHEMLGRPFTDFQTPAQAKKDLEVFARVKSGQRVFQHESEHLRKDGRAVQLSFNAVVRRDRQGRVVGATGTAVDVTRRNRALETLRAVAETTALAKTEDFFRVCVRNLARLYEARYAFIGAVTGDAQQTMRTIAVWEKERFGDNFTYDLGHSVCKDLLNAKERLIPLEVRKRYPKDSFLARRGIQSCFGMPLRCANGKSVGLVAVMDTGPMELSPWTEPVLQSVAHRIALELERTTREITLGKSEAQTRAIVETSPEGIVTLDRGGILRSFNPAAEHLFGYAVSEVMDQSFTTIIPDATPAQLGELVNRSAVALREHSLPEGVELVGKRRDGSIFPINLALGPMEVAGELLYVALIRDLSSHKEAEERLLFLAQHDVLTGLTNWREFTRRLDELIQHSKSTYRYHALCYLDIDQFKIVNDTCGHMAGDELLRQLAALLRAPLREGDTLARLGGDEFAILLRGYAPDEAFDLSHRLLETVRAYRFFWEGKPFAVTASIGLVIIRPRIHSAANAVSTADVACQMAKEMGRNRVRLYRSGDANLVQRHGEMHLIAQINKALSENRFRLVIQPIVPIQSHAADCGEHFEVMVRMVDEYGGLLPPEEFIPAAERYNVMPAIDRWIIQEIFSTQSNRFRELRRASRKKRTKPDFLFAINLSGTSVNDESFPKFVREQFARHVIHPEQVCFEITETAAIANLSGAAFFMRELSQLGCRFALDDFGSGLSSFRYLKTLPVEYLKIDGSFVRDLLVDPVDRAMVEAINQVGHAVGIRTIAEYVENEATLDQLRQIGVDFAQGYGLANPEPLQTSHQR
jgi:diguanylate cyclase (GGDEF)-like protein/PAS domain S-box-containing protein